MFAIFDFNETFVMFAYTVKLLVLYVIITKHSLIHSKFTCRN